jgi:type I restriction enzyme S subunit
MRVVELGKYVNIKTGKLDANANDPDGVFPFFTCSKEPLSISKYSYDCECVLVAGNGDLNVKYYHGKFDAYQRTYIIEAKDPSMIWMKYVYYFLDSYLGILRAGSIGGVIKYIKINNLTEALIPLPTYDEQKRIAAILDKAQNVVQKQKERIEKYDALAQSVFTEMFGEPLRNSKGFNKIFIKDILKDIVAGTSYGGEERELKNDELGVLKISAVTSGFFLPKEYKAIPKTLIKKSVISPKKGDLLFSRANTRELVGATCIVDDDYPNLFLPDKLWRLDLNNEKCDNYYLKAILTDIGIRNELTKTATGTSGSMLNISMNKLRDLEIPLPNISLQQEFKKIVTRIDNQKIKSKYNLEISNNLFSSLIQKAFNGDLTKTK